MLGRTHRRGQGRTRRWVRVGGALAVLAGSLLGAAGAGAQAVAPLLIDELIQQPVAAVEELPVLGLSFDRIRNIPDPPGDVIHSTGAEAGFTPGYNEFTEFQMGQLQVDPDTLQTNQFAAFAARETEGGAWCAPAGFGSNPNLHTACPENQNPWSLAPANDALYVEWLLEAELPLAPGGRCEFVVWGFDPGVGPPFGPIADPNPFPFDPALG
ncbi:MAG: hypothetical protein KJ698_06675, partial [Actinobacteria bacterium]|nr:hypothetical protein [Actinomycetota bacterium]